MPMDGNPRKTAAIPRTVWALGFVSLFMDVSSETIHGLLPLFLTTTLGASVLIVGVIDGVAEATASIVKVFSGYFSDRLRRRKPLILLGYGLAAITKPMFPLADGAMLVFTARFADRIGKGIRGAPRDALVADVTPQEIRGRAYGLRQALDTTGAFVGPLLAIALMFAFANDMRAVFWVAAVPAAIAVLVVIFGVSEDARPADDVKAKAPIRVRDLRVLDGAFWRVVAIAVVFSLARFSEAFLILQANALGLPLTFAPLVLVVMNVVYALGAYPAGMLADTLGARGLLLTGIALLIAADLVLAFASNVIYVFIAIVFWGAHMALTQGLFAKLVAERAPAAIRGSAFGIYHLTTGMALLTASVIAGLVWDIYGARDAFLTAAVFAGVAAVMLLAHSDYHFTGYRPD
ncbi:MAG: MFS transporter [Lysobacterales bacterium]